MARSLEDCSTELKVNEAGCYSCECSSSAWTNNPRTGTPNSAGLRRPSWPQPLTDNCPELPTTQSQRRPRPRPPLRPADSGLKIHDKRPLARCQTPLPSLNKSTHFFVHEGPNYSSAGVSRSATSRGWIAGKSAVWRGGWEGRPGVWFFSQRVDWGQSVGWTLPISRAVTVE